MRFKNAILFINCVLKSPLRGSRGITMKNAAPAQLIDRIFVC